jgi:hypothetical protein
VTPKDTVIDGKGKVRGAVKERKRDRVLVLNRVSQLIIERGAAGTLRTFLRTEDTPSRQCLFIRAQRRSNSRAKVAHGSSFVLEALDQGIESHRRYRGAVCLDEERDVGECQGAVESTLRRDPCDAVKTLAVGRFHARVRRSSALLTPRLSCLSARSD